MQKPAQGQTNQLLWTCYFFPDSLFFYGLTIFSQICSIFCSLCFPSRQGTSSLSCTGTGSAPITSLHSITALTFTGDRLRANYTPEGGDVFPKLGTFEAAREMSSSRCPIPIPPQPSGIRVSSHDAAVTAATEEGFEQEGGEKTGQRLPACGTGRRKCRRGPLLLAISSPRLGFYTDERGGGRGAAGRTEARGWARRPKGSAGGWPRGRRCG